MFAKTLEDKEVNMHVQLSSGAGGLNFELKSSSESLFCVCTQQRLWQDCIDVQACLKRYCLHMKGLHRLEKYLNLEGFLKKSLKFKSALKSTGKLLKSLEKS